MTAGTVVITGGILAAVILLCIIVVLCYCRLQYYCCKKHGSDLDAVCPPPQFSCNACRSSHLDGAVCTPLSLSLEPTLVTQSFCPACSPYASPFYIHTADETRNGGERVAFMPSRYDDPSLALSLSSRARSTDV